tara:strand:- start:40 stop:1455 length:1416 start_codon:yes stop_codon:yes gene_type:complete
MNNELYETNYTNNIECIYGEKRNKNDDEILVNKSLYNDHEYNVLFENRYNFSNYDTYSIDPYGCKDADDAFSVYEKNDKLYLAIHIADPTQFIPLNSELWKDIVNRTTTKYLSNRPPIHMMPQKILELSSLMTNNEDEFKNTISIITEIDKNNFTPIHNIELVFGIVRIHKNNALTYKNASLLKNELFALNIAQKIGESLFEIRKTKTKGTKLSELENSTIIYQDNDLYLYQDDEEEKKMKQMIAEFAIFANSFVGQYLKINLNTGIFRTCNASEWLSTVYHDISSEEMIQEIITNGIRADYMAKVESHDLVGMPEYCHFTSPIRRLSDCICHYLLKFIYFKKNNYKIPFEEQELNKLAVKCLYASKKDKKNQYLDNKFRYLQVMNSMIYKNGKINIKFYITGYSGLFLNIIICKINEFTVHMSYTLRIKNYEKEINPKEVNELFVNKVNCFTKYDENTIPQLDKYILEKN